MSIVNFFEISFNALDSKYDEVSHYLKPRLKKLIDHYQSFL